MWVRDFVGVWHCSSEVHPLNSEEVEVMECLQRPYDVRPCVINLPHLGDPPVLVGYDRAGLASSCHRLLSLYQDSISMQSCASEGVAPVSSGEVCGEVGGRKRTKSPVTSSITMYTAAQLRAIPGHTGYLTSATLHCKTLLAPQ